MLPHKHESYFCNVKPERNDEFDYDEDENHGDGMEQVWLKRCFMNRSRNEMLPGMLLHEMCLENYFRKVKPESDDDCEEEECRNKERSPGCQSFNDTLLHEHGSYVHNERRGNDADDEEERIWKERNKSSPGRKTRYDILPHEKRQRGFHKGIQESYNKNENVGGRPLSILSPGPRRTMSLFDLRSHNKKIIECASEFGRSISTMCLPSQSLQSCKARSPCSEEHSPEPCAGPSRESPRPGPSSFLAGPSKEFSRPGPSSFLAEPSKEFSRPGPSTFLAGLSKESSRPGPSTFLAGLSKESSRPGPSTFLAGLSKESSRPGPSTFLAGLSKESSRPGPSSFLAGPSKESSRPGPSSFLAGLFKESSRPGPSSFLAGPAKESSRPGPSSFLAGPSKESSRPGPSSFLAGPSKESSRPGPSSFLAGPSKESLGPGPSSFLAGPSKESPRPGPSSFLAGPSKESPRPDPSSPHAGPFRESPRPGPSSPHAGTSRECPMSGPISPRAGPSRESPGPRPTSPPLIHRSQFLEYLKQELIKQKLALKGPVLKSSAYFGQGPPNHLPLNQWLLDQGPLKRSLNKEPSNQASPNKEPVNQSSPSRRQSQARKPDEENRKQDLRNFTFGLRLDIICNHVRLDIITGKGIFEYVVEFFPQEDNQFFKNQMIRQHEEELGDALFFNGESLFLSTESNEEGYFECIHPTSDTRVKMSLKCKGRATDTDAEEIFNMVFRKIMTNLGVKNVAYRFLDPLGSINLTHYDLEIWPVIFSCVKKFDGGLQVCVNASSCVIHSKSVLELINRIQQGNPSRFQEECLKLIVGATVVTRYNHKMYEVYDICWDKHPESTFTTNQGNQISFFEYYLNHHQITVQDIGQPLLLANVTKTTDILKKNCQEELGIYLIPELCNIRGLTNEMKMNLRLVRDINQKFQPSPTILHDGICKLLQKISGNDMSQRLLSAWGFEVDAFPLRLEARVLNQETIWYKNARIDLTAGQTRWSVDHQLLITKQLRNWAILYLEDDKRLAQNLECNLRFVAGSMDMRIYPGKLIQVPENSTESYLHTLRCITDQLLQLVIFLFPSAQSDRYSAVKRFCCIDQPLLSQVILTQTLRNTFKIRTVIKNLVMQINCKLGGALWSLTVPFGKLMVCGINIFPDTSRKCLVMGFVASTNPLQLSWHSKVGFGASIEEFGDTLYLGMLSALRKYKEVSGVLPDRILVYREGISDEQLGLVDEIDIPNFRKSFRDAAVQYQPKLTVIVCQRKIMTRLMAVEETSGVTLTLHNPMPGVVLDHTITRCDMYDFFLVSQDNKCGTVSPTHYIVVHDSGDMPPERLQRMTYKMIHLYYNVPGLISIPTPVRYAHRLARLVGEHLHEEPSSTLSDKLYFI